MPTIKYIKRELRKLLDDYNFVSEYDRDSRQSQNAQKNDRILEDVLRVIRKGGNKRRRKRNG